MLTSVTDNIPVINNVFLSIGLKVVVHSGKFKIRAFPSIGHQYSEILHPFTRPGLICPNRSSIGGLLIQRNLLAAY